MNWLEVSLTVNGELAEAVADVFARYAPGGVVAERGIKYLDVDDPGTPCDKVTVRAYLPADKKIEELRQKIEEGISYLNMIRPLPAPTFTPVKDTNWMEAWKKHYNPLPVGKKLIITPAWMNPSDQTRIPIKIDPGMAFGTGTHPSTQLALELLEAILPSLKAQQPSPLSVIDVGCGSGILSIAALKLGAEQALGVDIEPASVNSARQNAAVNGIGEELIIGKGSVTEILTGHFKIRSAPLVLANMLAPILIRLTEAGLDKLVSPRGALILSGILTEQEPRIRTVVESHHLRIVERRQQKDWVAFLLRRTA